jgi:hypothetical protein
MDYIGIDGYFPVSKRHDSGRFEILAGWQQWLPAIERLHKNSGKPVLFTEIGYRSIDGAGMAPFDYRTWDSLDLQEQADLYWAALHVTAQNSWINGIFWWNWRADGAGGPSNTDYTPFDKPAENELRKAWGVQ